MGPETLASQVFNKPTWQGDEFLPHYLTNNL
jgi:hypothetical protein